MQNDFILTQANFKKTFIKRRNKSDIQNYLDRIHPLIHFNINKSIQNNKNYFNTFTTDKSNILYRKISHQTQRHIKSQHRKTVKTQQKSYKQKQINRSKYKALHNKQTQRLKTQSSLDYPLSYNKIALKPYQTHSNIKNNFVKKQLNKQYLQKYQIDSSILSKQLNVNQSLMKSNKIKCEVEMKQQIRLKIKNYVQNLDDRGQQELNNSLIESLKKQKKNHFNSKIIQHKIQQMIQTNRYIVQMIKQQLLNKNSFLNLTQNKFINHQNLSKNNYQTYSRVQSQIQNYESITTSQKIDTESSCDPHTIKQVSQQFFNQWQNGILHKKNVYQKFRKTLFQQYPIYAERQKINQNQKFSNLSQKKIQEGFLDMKECKIMKEKDQQIINSVLYRRKNQQLYDVKSSGMIRKTSFASSQKSTQNRLLLKRSLSKKSHQTIELSEADKKEIKQFNFDNLIQFIFKKAYFYSVSKKKILQNKIDTSSPIQICSPVKKKQQKSTSMRFLDFTSKKAKKQFYGSKNIMCKKLNSKGKYLIKNKQKIMNIRKEGNQSYEFFKKCLEDAIQDYVQLSTSKK